MTISKWIAHTEWERVTTPGTSDDGYWATKCNRHPRHSEHNSTGDRFLIEHSQGQQA